MGVSHVIVTVYPDDSAAEVMRKVKQACDLLGISVRVEDDNSVDPYRTFVFRSKPEKESEDAPACPPVWEQCPQCGRRTKMCGSGLDRCLWCYVPVRY